MTENDKKAVEICTYLGQRGFTVNFTDGDISINPSPDETLVKRITANESILTAMLASLELPPATNHPFVAPMFAKREEFREYGACIACGVPWIAHGEPPIGTWKLVKDANLVKLILASPLPVEYEIPV